MPSFGRQGRGKGPASGQERQGEREETVAMHRPPRRSRPAHRLRQSPLPALSRARRGWREEGRQPSEGTHLTSCRCCCHGDRSILCFFCYRRREQLARLLSAPPAVVRLPPRSDGSHVRAGRACRREIARDSRREDSSGRAKAAAARAQLGLSRSERDGKRRPPTQRRRRRL